MNTKLYCSMLFRSLAVFAAALAFSQAGVAGTVTQSAGPFSSDTCCWNQPVLGSVTLAQNTGLIDSLSSTAVAFDQGWGNYDPNSNQVTLELWNGLTPLWGVHAASGLRLDYSTQTFVASAADLAGVNGFLSGIDWSVTPTVTIAMVSRGLGYPGWELHVRDASFSVTSTVPEPTSLGLLGLGLAGLGFARRRKDKTA